MEHKTVKFTQAGATQLPDGKPVVYAIKTEGGRTNYVGVAKGGRVQERIREHLADGGIPGAKVHIRQMPSIREAKEAEKRLIAQSQPKYNDQGK